jgi:hypothetical protein
MAGIRPVADDEPADPPLGIALAEGVELLSLRLGADSHANA